MVSIETDAEAANYYEQAPAADRSKLSVLWAVLLREYRAKPVPLKRLMDEIGSKAERRGLTPAKLESILNADA
jgi:hypothetical protein